MAAGMVQLPWGDWVCASEVISVSAFSVEGTWQVCARLRGGTRLGANVKGVSYEESKRDAEKIRNDAAAAIQAAPAVPVLEETAVSADDRTARLTNIKHPDLVAMIEKRLCDNGPVVTDSKNHPVTELLAYVDWYHSRATRMDAKAVRGFERACRLASDPSGDDMGPQRDVTTWRHESEGCPTGEWVAWDKARNIQAIRPTEDEAIRALDLARFDEAENEHRKALNQIRSSATALAAQMVRLPDMVINRGDPADDLRPALVDRGAVVDLAMKVKNLGASMPADGRKTS